MSRTHTAILFRTHFMDARFVNFLSSLQGMDGYEVYILADARSTSFSATSIPIISITGDVLKSLELPTNVDADVLWQCGDYGLYVARHQLPHIQRFWLLEYDVFVNWERPADFFLFNDKADTSDFLGAFFEEASDTYIWARCMKPFFKKLYKCSYPILRINAEAVDTLYAQRCALAGKRLNGEMDWIKAEHYPAWPNDEAFTATALKSNGYTCHDLSALNNFDAQTFDVMKLLYHWDDLLERPADNKLYHSARFGSLYMRAARDKRKFFSEGGVDHIKTTLEKYKGQQWSPQDVEEILSGWAAG